MSPEHLKAYNLKDDLYPPDITTSIWQTGSPDLPTEIAVKHPAFILMEENHKNSKKNQHLAHGSNLLGQDTSQ